MDKNLTADFYKVRQDVDSTEKRIQEKFKLMEKTQKINFERCSDHGQRMFVLNIYFDEINIQAFEQSNIDEIKLLLVRYSELRAKQKNIETEIFAQKAIEKQNINVRKEYD